MPILATRFLSVTAFVLTTWFANAPATAAQGNASLTTASDSVAERAEPASQESQSAAETADAETSVGPVVTLASSPNRLRRSASQRRQISARIQGAGSQRTASASPVRMVTSSTSDARILNSIPSIGTSLPTPTPSSTEVQTPARDLTMVSANPTSIPEPAIELPVPPTSSFPPVDVTAIQGTQPTQRIPTELPTTATLPQAELNASAPTNNTQQDVPFAETTISPVDSANAPINDGTVNDGTVNASPQPVLVAVKPIQSASQQPLVASTGKNESTQGAPNLPESFSVPAIPPMVPEVTHKPPFAQPLPIETQPSPSVVANPSPLESIHVASEPIESNTQPILELAQAPTTYINSYSTPFVPESALSGSMLVEDYQLPSLFNHKRNAVGQSRTNWPCNNCGQDACDCRPVQWRFRGDQIFLHRSRADGFNTPLVRKFGNGIRPTIDCPADAISMGTRGSRRFTLIRDSLYEGYDFEATYYMIDQWNGEDSVNGDVGVVGFTRLGFGRAAVRYQSRMQNAEANVYKDLNNWTQFLVGFRWLQFDEFASVNAVTDLVPLFDQRSDTTNNLFGGQIGFRRSLWDQGGALTLNGTFKAGVFNNHIERSTFGFGTTPLDKNQAAFVGEVDLDMNIQMSRCWSLNLGYQFLGVTRVAEALDQFFSPDAIYDDGEPFLHGFRVGLTRTW